VLVPDGTPTSLGSGIFALLSAGVFPSVQAAQEKICLPFKTYTPQPGAVAVYEQLYQLYRSAYFALGTPDAEALPLGKILPELRRIAAIARN
jgi:L-ribulokinase